MLNGYTFRSTIAAMGSPPCIPLRKSNREAAGLQGGETIEVRLDLDTETRTIEPPADFVKAFKTTRQPGSDGTSSAIATSANMWRRLTKPGNLVGAQEKSLGAFHNQPCDLVWRSGIRVWSGGDALSVGFVVRALSLAEYRAARQRRESRRRRARRHDRDPLCHPIARSARRPAERSGVS
jgi:hypothetical protein